METSDIKKLARKTAGHYSLVSLYLNINAKERRHSDIDTVLTHLIEEEHARLNLSHDQLKHLRADLTKIRESIDEETFNQGKNRGLAVFSDINEGVFNWYYLGQPVEDRLVVGDKFFIRPLLGYMDANPKFLTLMVDQSRGRFFEIEQGEIADEMYFRDVVPNKVREGGWQGYEEHHIERHVDDHIHQHYKKVAQKAFNLFNKHDFKWLFLVGSAEDLANFKKTMHSYLQRKLIGEITLDITKKPSNEIFEQVLLHLNEALIFEHQQLEKELSDKNTNRAVVGLEKVDFQLDKKNVYKFLMSEGFRPVYPQCNNCNYLLHNQLVCPDCHTDLSALDFKSNEMVAKALFQDSEIHFIQNDYLDKNGGFGAILRY